ncbi:MAG: ribosome silencing factor [Actinomycetota bacterium]
MPERKDREQASSRDLAVAAARAAADKQGERIVVMDVRELIVITDYFVIASGGSERQVRTIVEEIERALRDLDMKPVRREGDEDRRWVLLDFVDIVVHVFAPEERDYYDLERLWRDAPLLEWENVGAASGS